MTEHANKRIARGRKMQNTESALTQTGIPPQQLLTRTVDRAVRLDTLAAHSIRNHPTDYRNPAAPP